MRRIGDRVYVSEWDCDRFASRWPGSGLEDKRGWFEFDSEGGLVDMSDVFTEGDVAEAAVLALSHDAQNYTPKSKSF